MGGFGVVSDVGVSRNAEMMSLNVNDPVCIRGESGGFRILWDS
jgi:hypothetical protein